jgi:hypothetical protein
MSTQAELDELAELEAMMGDIDDEQILAEQLMKAEQEALALANPGMAREISEQQAAENLKKKIAENKRLAAEKRQQYVLFLILGFELTVRKEDAQMEEYMRKEAEAQNATQNMAERIAQRKRELAEKKAREVCSSMLCFCSEIIILCFIARHI